MAVNNSITPTINTSIAASTTITDHVNTTSSIGMVITMVTSSSLETTNVPSTDGVESVTITIKVTTNIHELGNTITPSVSTNNILSRTFSVPITTTYVVNSTIITSNIPDQENSNNAGAIVGGILGAIVFITILIVIFIFIIVITRKRRENNYQISREMLTTGKYDKLI